MQKSKEYKCIKEGLSEFKIIHRRSALKLKIKAQTIQQYHILKWIDRNFYIDSLQVELIDRYNIKIIDNNENSAIVKYIDKDNIILEEVKPCQQ